MFRCQNEACYVSHRLTIAPVLKSLWERENDGQGSRIVCPFTPLALCNTLGIITSLSLSLNYWLKSIPVSVYHPSELVWDICAYNTKLHHSHVLPAHGLFAMKENGQRVGNPTAITKHTNFKPASHIMEFSTTTKSQVLR